MKTIRYCTTRTILFILLMVVAFLFRHIMQSILSEQTEGILGAVVIVGYVGLLVWLWLRKKKPGAPASKEGRN